MICRTSSPRVIVLCSGDGCALRPHCQRWRTAQVDPKRISREWVKPSYNDKAGCCPHFRAPSEPNAEQAPR